MQCLLYEKDLGHMQMSHFCFGTTTSAITKKSSFSNVSNEYEGLLPAWLYASKFQNSEWIFVSYTKLRFKNKTGHSCSLFEQLWN